MHKFFCDTCKKQIRKFGRCRSCDDEREYHTSCLIKVNDYLYCKEHAADHLDNKLIESYLIRTWNGLRMGGTLKISGLLDNNNSWATVAIHFPMLELEMYATYSKYDKTILFKPRNSDDTATHRIRLHHHAGFRKALKDLTITALERSIKNSERSIRNYQAGIKAEKETIEQGELVRDVLLGKREWPKPEPVKVMDILDH